MRLDEFVLLGQSLCIIGRPNSWSIDVVANEIKNFLNLLETCELHQTKIAAQALRDIEIPYNCSTKQITAVAVKQLEMMMQPIINTLLSEAKDKQLIAINSEIISQNLRDVDNQLSLTSSQKQLFNETILCLECGAYRSAILMGWCFGYDVIRWWIFNDKDRLNQFNSELASHTRKKDNQRLFDDITNYEDFFISKAPGESLVIEICEKAGLINSKIARTLKGYLDDRNNYAHANSLHPTANEADTFLKKLVDIITNSSFRDSSP
jgi:hypothetical protein